MTDIPAIAASYNKIARMCPQLTDAEESSLLMIRDDASRERLFRHNIRLALACVLKFKPEDMSVEDAAQLAMCGLLKAIDKFDVSYGTRLSTYACYWIRSEITSHTKLVGYARVDKCSKSMYERVGDDDVVLEEVVNGLVARDYDCQASNLGMDDWAVSGICDIVLGCLDALTSMRTESKRIVRHVLMELRDPTVNIMEAYRSTARDFVVSEREVRYLVSKACSELRRILLRRFGKEAEVSEVACKVRRYRIVNTRTLATRMDWDRFSLRSASKRRKLVSFYKDEHRNKYILGVIAMERCRLRYLRERKRPPDDFAASARGMASDLTRGMPA